MIIFRHELKAFLEANFDELFPTCTACDCPVAQFLRAQNPNFNGTVSKERIREYKADVVGGVTGTVEMTDNPAWLIEFIRQVDLRGVLRHAHHTCNTITGGEALSILNDVPS